MKENVFIENKCQPVVSQLEKSEVVPEKYLLFYVFHSHSDGVDDGSVRSHTFVNSN